MNKMYTSTSNGDSAHVYFNNQRVVKKVVFVGNMSRLSSVQKLPANPIIVYSNPTQFVINAKGYNYIDEAILA